MLIAVLDASVLSPAQHCCMISFCNSQGCERICDDQFPIFAVVYLEHEVRQFTH